MEHKGIDVSVTMSEEMVEYLKQIASTQVKIAEAAEHINAAAEVLSKLGLKPDDMAVIVGARAGVSKTSVKKIFGTLRRGDLNSLEILAMFVAAKENVGRDQARRTIRCLMQVVEDIEKEKANKGKEGVA